MKRRWTVLLEVLLMLGLGTWLVYSFIDTSPKPKGAINVKVQLRGAKDNAYLFRDDQGAYRYRITLHDGRQETLDPQQFAQRVLQDEAGRHWYEVMLNITSPIGVLWVTLGFLGQVLFTGRMVVQWLVSEKKKQSVVPPVFWWMSLVGSTMLLIYFLWRMDPVGVLGQAFGWFIYVRNLWLIYVPHQPPGVDQDPGPEPQAG